MKPIEGLNLSELVAKAYDADLEARAEETSKQIRAMINNRRSFMFMKEQKQKEMDKIDEKIVRLNQDIAKLSAGDWSVLKEIQQEKNNDAI